MGELHSEDYDLSILTFSARDKSNFFSGNIFFFCKVMYIERLRSAKYHTCHTIFTELFKSKNLESFGNFPTRYFLSGCDRNVREVKANGSSLSSISLVKILQYRHMKISKVFGWHFNLNVLHDNLKLMSLSVSANTRAMFRFFALSLSDSARDVSLNKGRSEKCFSPVAVFIDLSHM